MRQFNRMFMTSSQLSDLSFGWPVHTPRHCICGAQCHKANAQAMIARLGVGQTDLALFIFFGQDAGTKLILKPAVVTSAKPFLIINSNADYAFDKANRKSPAGTITLVNGMAVRCYLKNKEALRFILWSRSLWRSLKLEYRYLV